MRPRRPQNERERRAFDALDQAWINLDHIQRRTDGDVRDLATAAVGSITQALSHLGLLDYAYARLDEASKP